MKKFALTAIVLALSAPAYAQEQQQPQQPQQLEPPAAQAPAPTPAPVTPEGQSGQVQVTPEVTETKPAEEKMASDSERFLESQEQDQLLASRLIGQNAFNAAGQSVGNVNDLVIGKEGDVQAVVIGVGGFLGLGEKRVAINFDQIKESGGFSGDRLVLGMSEEDLRAAPEFKRLDRGQEMAETQQAPADQPASSKTETQ